MGEGCSGQNRILVPEIRTLSADCREFLQDQPSKEVGFTSARNRHMYHEGSRFGKYNFLIFLP